MNPIGVMLTIVVTCGLLAAPIATYWDPQGAYYVYLNRLHNQEYIWVAWFCTAYAFAVMAFLYRFLRLGRNMAWQAGRPGMELSRKATLLLWGATFLVGCITIVVVLYQSEGRHPLLTVDAGADAMALALRRREVAAQISRTVLNLGLILAMPLNLLLATTFLKNRVLSLMSLALYVALGTFPLEKAPLVLSVLNLLFFRMLWRPLRLRLSWQIAMYGVAIAAATVTMYWATRTVANPRDLGQRFYERVIYGTISDLPYYFEIFDQNPIPLTTALPTYVRAVTDGNEDPPACRRVIEYSMPWAVHAGYAGVANSFFVGEAFAVGGYPFVLLSPFLVMFNVWVAVWFFRGLPKTPLTTYGQSVLLFILFANLFLGIGSYIFSAMHLLLAFYFVLHFLSKLRRPRRLYPYRYGDPAPAPGGMLPPEAAAGPQPA